MAYNMNLDDLDRMRAIDVDEMLSHIDALPDQLENAWRLAQTLPLPESHQAPRLIALCGMGGSAIGGDLAAAIVAPTSPAPFVVLRSYDLPAFVTGPETLVIASSNSGNTEETLAAAEIARERGARLLAITTGGQLADHAARHGYPLWQFDYKSQPRAALGWSLGLLLGLADRLKLAPDLGTDLAGAIALLRETAQGYGAGSSLATNPAKRTAGQLIGRVPLFVGAGIFEPVARRWKCQLNENAKAWAEYEPMPETNHNTVAAIGFPADHNVPLSAIIITSPTEDHPRVRLRNELMYTMCLQNGIMADTFQPQGATALAQLLHAVQFGDYLSYYTAIGYGVDPTAIAPIVELKEQLARSH